MNRWAARPATSEAFQLGEGPVWDASRSRLLWVDIVRGAVIEGSLDGEDIDVLHRQEFSGTVGAVAVTATGQLLVAGQESLLLVGPDGRRRQGPRIVASGSRRRLNDGKSDPAGRYLVGTLFLDGDSSTERLVRLEHDGTLTTLDDDLSLSNGIGWSVDGSLLYTVDSHRRSVFVRDYDPATAEVGQRRPLVRLDDGYPDGLCVDAADHLWLAVWGRGEVRRYAPDGTLVGVVHVPAPHTSSVAFAGDDLDLLVITTAWNELTDQQRADHPHSGRLFTVRVGVAGTPVAPCLPPQDVFGAPAP